MPFSLENTEHTLPSSTLPLSLHTVYKSASPQAQDGPRWAMQQGRPVIIDMEAVFEDSVWEGFEDALGKSTADLEKVPPIILCMSPTSLLGALLANAVQHTFYHQSTISSSRL